MAKPYKLLTIVASEYGKYASLETVVSIERIDSKLYYNLGKLQGLEYNAVQFVLSRPISMSIIDNALSRILPTELEVPWQVDHKDGIFISKAEGVLVCGAPWVLGYKLLFEWLGCK
jgi:hypothetical protein